MAQEYLSKKRTGKKNKVSRDENMDKTSPQNQPIYMVFEKEKKLKKRPSPGTEWTVHVANIPSILLPPPYALPPLHFLPLPPPIYLLAATAEEAAAEGRTANGRSHRLAAAASFPCSPQLPLPPKQPTSFLLCISSIAQEAKGSSPLLRVVGRLVFCGGQGARGGSHCSSGRRI